MDIGEKIKILREKKKKTQLDIAKFLGVTYQTIYKYEKGIAIPPADAIIKLAEYFNVTTDYLLGKTDIKQTINEPIEIAASMKDKADLSEMSDKDKAYILDLIERLKGKES